MQFVLEISFLVALWLCAVLILDHCMCVLYHEYDFNNNNNNNANNNNNNITFISVFHK